MDFKTTPGTRYLVMAGNRALGTRAGEVYRSDGVNLVLESTGKKKKVIGPIEEALATLLFRECDPVLPYPLQDVRADGKGRVVLQRYVIRESMIRLKGDKAERAFPAGLPEKAPDAQDTGHKLWVVSKASTEIYTESNAAWDLYERCQYTKLSIADAKALVLPKFEGRYCSWDYILERFRKLGGRHTDLYLRVDR